MTISQVCCQVCKKNFSQKEVISGTSLRPNLQKIAMNIFENFNLDHFICLNDLRVLRDKRIEMMIEKLKDIDPSIKESVMDSIQNDTLLAINVDDQIHDKRSLGDIAADKMAKFGGSWLFIGIFIGLILTWMFFNHQHHLAFDPFPFIFLNLFLSCIAAFQAPIIMMSQNRQAEKDRIRDVEDYKVNLKAELEIQQLHTKLDQFVKYHWSQLMEVQKLQIEIAEDLVDLTSSLKEQLAIRHDPEKDRTSS